MPWSILLYKLETSTLIKEGWNKETGSLRNVVMEETAKVETADKISNEEIL